MEIISVLKQEKTEAEKIRLHDRKVFLQVLAVSAISGIILFALGLIGAFA